MRTLKKIPTNLEYEEHGKYSLQPLRKRFGALKNVPEGMKQYAEERGLTAEWADESVVGKTTTLPQINTDNADQKRLPELP